MKVKSLRANYPMNLLSVKRKGHGIVEWIRRETLNSRGFQLVKTQALLYNKYHHVSHNDWVLIACSDRNISNPSKSSMNITRKKKAIWKNSEMSNYCYFLGETLLISSWVPQQNVSPREFYKVAILKKWKLHKMHCSPSLYSSYARRKEF